jgi:tetratricopeptide (TPR) repeat protein
MMRRAPVGVGVLLALVPIAAFPHAGVEVLDEATRVEVAKHPERAQALLDRARVLALKRDWDAALEALEQAAGRGADADVVGARKAEVYLDAGFPRMAIVEVDRVLARRPSASDLLVTRARARLALGDAEAAARDFGEAIAKGSRPTPEQVLARRDALLAIGRREEALRALDEGMTRVGRVVSLVLPAVDLEVELGRYEAALGRLDALARTAAPNPLWSARRGDVLAKAGRRAEARAAWAQTLALLAARPQARHGSSFEDLKRRVETALASADHEGDTR